MENLARIIGTKQQTLKEHLEQVSAYMESRSPDKYKQIAKFTGMLHDLGKYNPQWQQYLQNKTKQVYHSKHGAEYCKGSISEIIIAGHHTCLSNYSDLNKQVDYDLDSELEKCLSIALHEIDLIDKNQIKQLQKSTFPSRDFNEIDVAVRMLYSQLIDADRLNAQYFAEDKQWSIEQTSYSMKIEAPNHKPSAIADDRKEFNRLAMEAIDIQGGFLRLTGPTGIGKTVTAFQYADKLCRIKNKQGIIYVAPLNSISEQTSEVAVRLFPNQTILNHYGTFDIAYSEDNDIKRYKDAQSRWTEQIIITSMVQFLESLFSNRPGKTRKLQGIANKVILFDEIQSLPFEYTKPVLDVLFTLTQHWGVTVIFMSATQPVFTNLNGCSKFEFNDIVARKVTDAISNKLKRTNIKLLESKSLNDFVDFAIQKCTDVPSAFITLNTCKASRQVYDLVCSKQRSHKVIYLSGYMWHDLRQKAISLIKQYMSDGIPVIAVTTQVIEAGIDLDFHIGFRQFCPLPSALQIAGRINRSGNRPTADLYVCEIEDINNLPAYNQGNIITIDLLKQNTPDIDIYYQRYLNGIFDSDAYQITQSRRSFNFKDVAEKFEIIKNSESVVVPVDAIAHLEHKEFLSYADWQLIQKYTVNIHFSKCWNNVGTWENGLKFWKGGYDDYGIIVDAIDWVL